MKITKVKTTLTYTPLDMSRIDSSVANPFTIELNNDDIQNYLFSDQIDPLLLCGDSLDVLKQIPDQSIDCCMTSPPYWGKREYSSEGIGLEADYSSYIHSMLEITAEIYRVLKPTGSFWLNIGDTYLNKSLQNIPWRIAIAMTDSQNWIQRNAAIWNKVKGNPDNANDKLRNMYEPVFHFVKRKNYYYNVDVIRNEPKKAIKTGDNPISATGVSGKKYRKQIMESTVLTDDEKDNALRSLDAVLNDVGSGVISDFRMVIRGQQRTTHSNSKKVSGRAKELESKGFYFLKYNPKGSKPGDVWEIIPEDTQKRDDNHFAPYPEELCYLPLKTTCPSNGVVLDPFCGTGTTLKVAKDLGLKSIGIDISLDYIELVRRRLNV